MAKRTKWQPQVVGVHVESVRDSEFAETLAELGRLIYLELRSRQLRNDLDPNSIATSTEKIVSRKTRKDGCE